MNGWAFGAVAVASLALVVVALLWALVRVGQQRRLVDGSGVELVGLSADEELQLQAGSEWGRADVRRQIAEAADRARREREGGF